MKEVILPAADEFNGWLDFILTEGHPVHILCCLPKFTGLAELCQDDIKIGRFGCLSDGIGSILHECTGFLPGFLLLNLQFLLDPGREFLALLAQLFGGKATGQTRQGCLNPGRIAGCHCDSELPQQQSRRIGHSGPGYRVGRVGFPVERLLN